MATIVIGTLRALLSADTANFESGMRKAAGATKGFTATSKDVTRAAQSIGSAFAAMNIGASAAASAKRLSEIADAADRIGISAEAVQKLGFAAQQGGSSIEAVGNSIRFMADMLGNEKQATALMERLGLNLAEIKAQSPDQAFTAIADAIAKIPDPLERSDIATNAFGRGAVQLMPAILAGFTDIGNQAPVMSNAVVAAGDQTDDALAKMHTRMDNLKAQALLPLVNAFVALPEPVQLAVGAVATLMPSLEALAIGVLALGGPKGALAVLMASFGSIVTLFTTTLPAAFTSILAFLGPVGLIAVAVIALGVVWVKWGDDIKRIVAAVYEAIKTWLVDKFNAVVASIKAKIDAIVGYFKGMYTAVVGQSFVPDMVDGIEREFGRLGQVMVNPTEWATSRVEGLFGSMAGNVEGIFGGLLNKLNSKVQGWLSVLPGFLAGPLGALAGGAIGALGGLAVKGIKAIGRGIGRLFGFGGGNDTPKSSVSLPRTVPAPVRSFAMGGFVPPGDVVPAILHGGTHGEDVIPRGQGGMATSINLTIHAMDGADVKRVFKAHIIPLMKRAMMLNEGDIRTTMLREVTA